MEVMKPHLARVASPTATSTSSSWSAAVVAGRKRRERLAEGAVRRGLKPAHQVAFGAPDLDDGARVHRHGRRPAGAEGAHALTGTCSEWARFLARTKTASRSLARLGCAARGRVAPSAPRRPAWSCGGGAVPWAPFALPANRCSRFLPGLQALKALVRLEQSRVDAQKLLCQGPLVLSLAARRHGRLAAPASMAAVCSSCSWSHRSGVVPAAESGLAGHAGQ